MRFAIVCCIGLTLVSGGRVGAQLSAAEERAELSARLRAFESAWEDADAAGRNRALAILPRASEQFLGLNLKESGRALDLARYALSDDGEPGPGWELANSMAAQPSATLLDRSGPRQFCYTAQKFYAVKDRSPPVYFNMAQTEQNVIPEKALGSSLGKDPFPLCLPVTQLGGTYVCFAEIYKAVEGVNAKDVKAGQKLMPPRWTVVRVVVDLEYRLNQLRSLPKTLPPLEAASLADYRSLLAQFTKGEPTDSQWLTPRRTLDTAEAIRRDPPGGYFRASPGVNCEFWLTVPTPDAKTQCRIRVPGVPAGKKVPVVVALHGVGGSEHMFPEAYGAGCLAKASANAGFAVVCPRGSLFGAPPVPDILAELAKRFPLDLDQVHLVGHSLGASQAAELCQRPGQPYQTVTLLAGGGRVRNAERLKSTRLFLAVGNADFAAKSTRKFHQALLAAGTKPTYREYPQVEHLTIVRHAIDDIARHWAAK